MKKRTIALLCGCGLLIGIASNGSMAYLTSTDSVENTFTVGDVAITLQENWFDPKTKTLDETRWLTANEPYVVNEYTFVPGITLPKNPIVTVDGESENCWLFICVEEVNNGHENLKKDNGDSDRIINFDLTSDWSLYSGPILTEDKDGVKHVKYFYYYSDKNSTATANGEYPILLGNQVTVNENLTKEMANDRDSDDTRPRLEFTAAAIQKDDVIDTLELAWENLPGGFTGESSTSNN